MRKQALFLPVAAHTCVGSQAKTLRDTAETFQPRCHLGANGSASGQDPVKRLACYAKVSSRLTDGQLQARQHVIAQQRAGMFGLPVGRSRMSTPVHGYL
jgi:hypothetical protein